jgi:hypothetical protein
MTGYPWDWPFSKRVVVVPPISLQYLDAVVFLYATEQDANQSWPAGGCGFLVGVQFDDGRPIDHLYVVTCSHNIDLGFPIVRVTSQRGGVEVLPKANWVKSKDFDLAIQPVPVQFGAWWRQEYVPDHKFLDVPNIHQWPLVPGDEVFTVGRFIGQDGTVENHPLVHTGVIALLPFTLVENPEMHRQELSILVELHSRPGYSGSPVFGYMSEKIPSLGVERTGIPNEDPFVFLLGMQRLLITRVAQLTDVKGADTGQFARIPTGIAAVVPAWEIHKLLKEHPDLIEQRQTDEAKYDPEGAIFYENASQGAVPTPETADLMGKLFQVPKDEADEVHRQHDRS